jgi:hypothetical protein
MKRIFLLVWISAMRRILFFVAVIAATIYGCCQAQAEIYGDFDISPYQKGSVRVKPIIALEDKDGNLVYVIDPREETWRDYNQKKINKRQAYWKAEKTKLDPVNVEAHIQGKKNKVQGQVNHLNDIQTKLDILLESLEEKPEKPVVPPSG